MAGRTVGREWSVWRRWTPPTPRSSAGPPPERPRVWPLWPRGQDRRPGAGGGAPFSPFPQGDFTCLSCCGQPFSLAELSQLTAWTAGGLVCRGSSPACGAEPQIKWTNDILSEWKKAVGVLTELELEAESAAPSHVVGGPWGQRGVRPPRTFGPELADIATSLELEGFSVRRAELAGQILAALDDLYAAFPAGKADYLSDYRARCATTGREVLLLRGDAQVPAFAEAVDDDFGLVVRCPDGRRETVTSGEVSVRGLMGQYV